MLATITSNDLVAFAVIGGFLLACGGAIGRKWGTTKKHREAEQKMTETADNTIQQMVWSMTGKPADQWGPAEKGLIEQTAKLNSDFRTHETDNIHTFTEVRREVHAFSDDNARVLEKLVERLERTEEKAATAAAAVLDTAASAAAAKELVSAEAAAKVLATAVAAEFKKTRKKRRK